MPEYETPPGSVQHCAERVLQAARELATGLAPLPERIEGAAEILAPLMSTDFPPDLRINFARISEATTAAGSIEATVYAMSAESAREIADNIWDLAAEVTRRETLEKEADD